MPRYTLDKTGHKLILDERSIGEDGRFPDVYPDEMPDGSENPNGGKPHPQAGQINWDYLTRDCGFHRTMDIVPYDEKQNLELNARATGVTVRAASIEGVSSQIESDVTANLEARIDKMVEARVNAILASRAAGVRRGRPPKSAEPEA